MDENEIIPLEKSEKLESMSLQEMIEYNEQLQLAVLNIEKEIKNRKSKKIEAEKFFEK